MTDTQVDEAAAKGFEKKQRWFMLNAETLEKMDTHYRTLVTPTLNRLPAARPAA